MAAKRRERRISRMQRHHHVIENRQRRVRLPVSALERFLVRVNRDLGLHAGSAFVRFVGDSEMKRLNRRFRKKAKTTDVLSFPWEKRTQPASLRRRAKQLRGAFLGDIAISPTVARRNAERFGRTTAEEVCILMLHGFLHLLGYDHETDRGEMERVEATLRRRLGLS